MKSTGRRRGQLVQPSSGPLSDAIAEASGKGLGISASMYDQVNPWLRLVVQHRIGSARMSGRIGADDIMQSAWLVMLRRLKRGPLQPKAGRRSGAFLAYITVIANRLVFAEARRLWRMASLPSGSQLQASAPSPSSVVGGTERDSKLQRRLDEAMAALAPTDREIVRLRGIEGASALATGLLLGLSAEVVHKRYSRARSTLQARLGDLATALLTPA